MPSPTNNDVLLHFLSGNPAPKQTRTSALIVPVGGHILYSYGSHFVLAVRMKGGKVWVNNTKTTKTTTRLRNNLIDLLREKQPYTFTVVDDVTIKQLLEDL